MFTAKKVFLGSLAVGGVAAVGYYGYRYYKYRSTSSLEVQPAETRQKKEKKVKKILKKAHTVREKESAEKYARQHKRGTANQVHVNRATMRLQRFESAQNQVKQFTKTARVTKSKSQSETPKIQDVVPQEPVQKDKQAEAETHQEATDESEDDEPWQNILSLQHVRTAEELDTTFEAVARHYFVHERSVEELEEAKKALGWAWPLVLDCASRLPQNVSSSSVETE